MFRHLEQPQILTASRGRIALLPIEIAVAGVDLPRLGQFADQLHFKAFRPGTGQGRIALIVQQDRLVIAVEAEHGGGQAERRH